MLKELNKSDFATTILKDLGMKQPNGTKRKMRYVELECTECNKGFTLTADNAKRRQEHKCASCKAKPAPGSTPEFIKFTKEFTDGMFKCSNCNKEFESSIVTAHNNTYKVCPKCRSLTDSMVSPSGEFNVGIMRQVLKYDPKNGTLSNIIRNRPITPKDGGRVTLNHDIAINIIRIIYALMYDVILPDRCWFIFKDSDRTNIKLENISFKLQQPHKPSTTPRKVITYEKFKQNLIDANITTREEAKAVSGYGSMNGKGLAIKAFEDLGIVKRTTTWTIELAKERAKAFNTRIEFKKKDPTAYDYTIRYSGCADDIMSHMVPASNCDYDAIYIWKAIELDDVYKIGVTSARLGSERIEHVSRKSGLEYEIIILAKVTVKASVLETIILNHSVPYEFSAPFDGSTEFRTLSRDELSTAIKLIEENTNEQ